MVSWDEVIARCSFSGSPSPTVPKLMLLFTSLKALAPKLSRRAKLPLVLPDDVSTGDFSSPSLSIGELAVDETELMLPRRAPE